MQLILNGAVVNADMQDSLSRAIVISLFSWKRADENDIYDKELGRQGWWGDSLNDDKIGSKLWQLLRNKITSETIFQAEEMVFDALKWLIDDGICTDISVSVERDSDTPDRLNVSIILEQSGKQINYQIKDLLNGND
ncbi:MAG: phage GP46 family protein [Succinatimonas hippei]|nr:phage GP46 family protein [Succinatimonas hippei]